MPTPLRWPSYRQRLALYALLLLVVAWFVAPHPWWPSSTLRTAHFTIDTSATPAQAADTGEVLEALYRGYTRRFLGTTEPPMTGPLHVRLHGTLVELRTVNPGLGWGKSFYDEPLSHGFYDAGQPNPTHWVAHEVVHQLTHEVAHFTLEKWLEEGLATHAAATPPRDDSGSFDRVDWSAYPAWHLQDLATAPTLEASQHNGSAIALRSIVTGQGGPSLDDHVTLFYLHWWTLTRFLLEHPRHRQVTAELLRTGGHLADVERLCGPLAEVEREWFTYVRELRGQQPR